MLDNDDQDGSGLNIFIETEEVGTKLIENNRNYYYFVKMFDVRLF